MRTLAAFLAFVGALAICGTIMAFTPAAIPARFVADEALGQSGGNMWMYPPLNSSSQFLCILDAGAGAPVDNTTTSWDGGCTPLPSQSCYEVQCNGAAYITTFTDAGSMVDAYSESLSSGQFWYQCFAGSPLIAVDSKSGGIYCNLFLKRQR